MTFADAQRQRSAENRISPVFWVLLATFGTSAWMVWSGLGNAKLGVFLFVVAGWMVSLCLHEYAHARTAMHGGDLTIGAKGYLTLNPFKYANPLFSFVMPIIFIALGGIGLPGGAVYIERHRIEGRLKHSLISAAGPLVNVVFAIALLVPLGAGWLHNPDLPAMYQGFETRFSPIEAGFAFLGLLQVSAAILNLLPVPGLDGYGIIEPWLSLKTRRAVAPFAAYGMLAVFIVLWQSPLGGWFFTQIDNIMTLSGVTPGLPELGRYLFQFWSS